jgi:hypothetical protein
MLWRAKVLRGYHLRAVDGALGQVEDFYFDDHAWVLRYMVVDTSRWLGGRRVLVAPGELGTPDSERGEFPLNLTMDKIRSSPDIDTAKPVSRQEEERLFAHYGWAPYWVGFGGGYASGLLITPPEEPEAAAAAPRGDPNLRSMREVTGYHIAATDGSIGHVADFLIDEEGWAVRYLEVDTRNWLPGKHVLVAPHWVKAIDWSDRQVAVAMTRRQIADSPAYDPHRPLERAYEDRLHSHYGYDPYWHDRGV